MRNEYRDFAFVAVDGKPYDTKGRAIESCIESVSDGGRFITSHVCGKKLKGDAEFPWLCGLHVSAIRRARSKEAKRAETKARRQAELETENAKLIALNARLGIRSTLQTTMPTTGPDAFIGVSTGYAIVRLDQLENLANQISEAHKTFNELEEQLRLGGL